MVFCDTKQANWVFVIDGKGLAAVRAEVEQPANYKKWHQGPYKYSPTQLKTVI